MRFRDPATVAGAVLARVTTDAAGADVRALLPAGLDGVISADDLEKGIEGLPARPLLALSLGGAPDNGAFDQHLVSWWIYDDPGMGHSRIGALSIALVRAYDVPRGAPPLSVGPALPGALSEPRIDTALGLRARRLDLTVNA